MKATIKEANRTIELEGTSQEIAEVLGFKQTVQLIPWTAPDVVTNPPWANPYP